ncbi:MAG: UbiA family prenyltransferase [Candidatus Tectomicrobia bacterium]|nr:UbiA family prenyltransferase [Candidatus Tectomicrobia bacterium]
MIRAGREGLAGGTGRRKAGRRGGREGGENPLRGFIHTAAQIFRLVKFEHSVFALPIVLAGAFLAARGIPSPGSLAWIIAAAVGARNFAFALNRLADKEFDLRNPRTRDRTAFRRILDGKGIWAFLVASLGLFLLAAAMLNRLTLWLSPVVVGAIVLYSYSKRWTWGTHGLLGAVYGCAAAGAWIAVRGDLTAIPLWLALGASAWVAGFDLIYACLDVDFDRAERLHSVPARFGIPAGLRASKALHLVTAVSFLAVGWLGNLGAIYWAAWALGSALLVCEHYLVRPGDLSRVDFSFFHLNAWFSVILGVGVITDALWRSPV